VLPPSTPNRRIGLLQCFKRTMSGWRRIPPERKTRLLERADGAPPFRWTLWSIIDAYQCPDRRSTVPVAGGAHKRSSGGHRPAQSCLIGPWTRLLAIPRRLLGAAEAPSTPGNQLAADGCAPAHESAAGVVTACRVADLSASATSKARRRMRLHLTTAPPLYPHQLISCGTDRVVPPRHRPAAVRALRP
jgi:hypothetical protein